MDTQPTGASVSAGRQESWVIVAAGENLYAVPSVAVRTMVIVPPVTCLPGAARHVRGVINLRGAVFPLLDLRTRCGMESLAEHVAGLCKMLEAREQDHRNWLAELEKSVSERRPFGLTTDPHKCAFGKWYDHFHTTDLILAGILRNFDEPHKAIHKVAHAVEEAKQRGEFQRATELIAEVRVTVLEQLMRMFASLREHLTSGSREIALVVEGAEGKAFALAVDRVDSTDTLPAADTSGLPSIAAMAENRFVRGIAKRSKDQQIVLMLDVDALYQEEEVMAGVA